MRCFACAGVARATLGRSTNRLAPCRVWPIMRALCRGLVSVLYLSVKALRQCIEIENCRDLGRAVVVRLSRCRRYAMSLTRTYERQSCDRLRALTRPCFHARSRHTMAYETCMGWRSQSADDAEGDGRPARPPQIGCPALHTYGILITTAVEFPRAPLCHDHSRAGERSRSSGGRYPACRRRRSLHRPAVHELESDGPAGIMYSVARLVGRQRVAARSGTPPGRRLPDGVLAASGTSVCAASWHGRIVRGFLDCSCLRVCQVAACWVLLRQASLRRGLIASNGKLQARRWPANPTPPEELEEERGVRPLVHERTRGRSGACGRSRKDIR
ncbi:hypothetical protein BV20DRAFT_111052 [Pilatotrama ljubarskyi]|nr:hypothetical protein BV20DRAFT_111052 [Pilatotrama ljubarskyi]